MTDRIQTGFGFATRADEVLAGVDLSGRRAVVTGANSGIGVETARALAGAGAEVTLAVRRPEAGRPIAADITATTGNAHVRVEQLDLADLASVTAFGGRWSGPLHILVNNAGIMALPELERSPEGWEAQFATNFMGHFALVQALHDALAAAGGARVVCLSSTGHLFSPVIFDDLHYHFRPYDPWSAYGQSKTADVLLAVGITRHWSGEGILANAAHPGAIATNLQKHTGGLRSPEQFRKTPPQGAATSVLLAASPLLDGIGGRYFEDCNESPVLERSGPMGTGGVAPFALDPANADRLWDTALALLP
ncbi:SDR family NAD(P)-dependent oxidoreductase [Streptomyces avicenniae]|uniref:SDR family NAD(P)-dependent oxidoreductase n=1 Tax=Streptomyces avicenniae TaxID=500153 RepID=UPI00069B07EA|nr:SDR family NAD(P)-dependent oxidoreductase [Streptomyces avicenniae]